MRSRPVGAANLVPDFQTWESCQRFKHADLADLDVATLRAEIVALSFRQLADHLSHRPGRPLVHAPGTDREWIAERLAALWSELERRGVCRCHVECVATEAPRG